MGTSSRADPVRHIVVDMKNDSRLASKDKIREFHVFMPQELLKSATGIEFFTYLSALKVFLPCHVLHVFPFYRQPRTRKISSLSLVRCSESCSLCLLFGSHIPRSCVEQDTASVAIHKLL